MITKPYNSILTVALAFVASSVIASPAYAQFGAASSCSGLQIGGNIFRDFNASGTRESGEPGQIGVRATAYDKGNLVLGTAISDIDGNFKIDLSSAAPEIRVEITEIPAYLKPGPSGAGSVTTVAFGSAGNCAFNVGIANAAQYCEENPKLALPCYTNGDPLDNTTSYPHNSSDGKSIVEFDYDSTGSIGVGPTPTRLTNNALTGPTWGLAYQRSTKSIFASAFLRRHTGFGPGGSGAIYKIDRSDPSNPITSILVDLQALGIDTGIDPHTGLSGDAAAPSHDDATFALVGRMSLGDMDISEDQKTLWITNLFDKKLYSIFIDNPVRTPTAADIQGYAIPNPGCSNGEFVAFATKVHDGAIYLGVNCTAETSRSAADLFAYVLKFDGVNFTQVFSLDLDYTKGYGIHPTFNPLPSPGYNWVPWARDILDLFGTFPHFAFIEYPQPMFSNIEFDNDGSLVVNIADRTASQFGPFNYNVAPFDNTFVNAPSSGDILRACQVGSQTWVLENNSVCPGSSGTLGMNNGQGPGGGEFYFEELWSIIRGDLLIDVHQETALGAAVIKPGADTVKLTSYDLYEVEDGGLSEFSNSTGQVLSRYEIYSAAIPGGFGKSSGLGDLELICEEAPIQIGNRVWRDLNGNGRQDADDFGIAGVTVHLYDGTSNVLLATKITSSDGTYYFEVADGLYPNGNFTVRIDNPADYAAGGPLVGLVLTIPNNADDAIDSDSQDVDGFATISVTTGPAGTNDHTFDAGFGQLQCEQKDLTTINAQIDGSALGISKLVKKSVSYRKKLAKKFGKKKCKKLSSSKEKEIIKLANATYNEAWTLAWSYGTSTNVCESLLTVCTQSDISAKINSILAEANTLSGLVTSALSGNGCTKATTSTKKKFLKQAAAYLATINSNIAELQALNPLITCK